MSWTGPVVYPRLTVLTTVTRGPWGFRGLGSLPRAQASSAGAEALFAFRR